MNRDSSAPQPAAMRPLAGEIATTTIAVVEQTFAYRQTEALQHVHDLDRPAIFADVLAVETMKAYQAEHPRLTPLRATISESNTAGGSASYEVSLRDDRGSGVRLSVDEALNISVTPIQHVGNRDIALPEQQFRWNDSSSAKDGHLEHAVEMGGRAAWVPYANPALAGGDDLEVGAKLLIDQALSAHNSGQTNRFAVLSAVNDDLKSDNAVRAFTGTNVAGHLFNGYLQQGTISYNGFSVVEQACADHKSVVYNKADLLRHATDPRALESILHSSNPVDIGIRDGAVVSRMVVRDLLSNEVRSEGTTFPVMRTLPDGSQYIQHLKEPFTQPGTIAAADAERVTQEIGRGHTFTYRTNDLLRDAQTASAKLQVLEHAAQNHETIFLTIGPRGAEVSEPGLHRDPSQSLGR